MLIRWEDVRKKFKHIGTPEKLFLLQLRAHLHWLASKAARRRAAQLVSQALGPHHLQRAGRLL